MGIGGVNDYSSLFQNYRVPSIPTVSVEEVKKQDLERSNQENLPVLSTEQSYNQPAVTQPAKPNAQLEDISLTFRKEDDFGTIGRDSDLMKLDMEKAISGMQKDSILKDYQFFVGSAQGGIMESADGIVIPKF